MKQIATINSLRQELGLQRRAGRRIGFVPTMGYLHAGHMALVARAKAECDFVVASIFVNPLQFGPNEDFARYPRDLERDSALLGEAGVDVLFAPAVEEMYPRPMETVVEVTRLSTIHEGAARPGHFRGVATVVSKLFNIVQPDCAYFGEKDFQQLTVIRRMVEDLAMPVDIVGVTTVRDADGVAMSSRNVYLSAEERKAAPVLSRSLAEAERLVAEGVTLTADLERGIRAVLGSEPLANPDVVAICDADSLAAAGEELPERIAIMLAVRFGKTRLLDQRVILRPANHEGQGHFSHAAE